MRKSFLLIWLLLGSMLFSVSIKAQFDYHNLSFNLGDFSNWQAYTGSCLNGVDTIYPCQPISGKHSIMDARGVPILILLDEYCNTIPKTPSRFFSARLGNDTANAKINALKYTINIDNFNSLLKVHFAFVLENPQNHNLNERPRFTIQIRDSLGNPLPNFTCCNLDFVADTGLHGLTCTGAIVARDWTTVGLNLEQFIGQTIKLYFEVRDGSQGNHFGYAYIIAECTPSRFDATYCDGEIIERFRAPDGFVGYRWTKTSDSLWVGNGRTSPSIVVLDRDTFTCLMTSGLDTNCTATIHLISARIAIEPNFVFEWDTCNHTATFTDISTFINTEKDEILWEIPELNVTSRDSLFIYTFPDSDDDNPVDYLVRLTVFAENGCSYRNNGKWEKEDTITVFPFPKVQITGANQLCIGDSAYLKATPIRHTFINHTWTWEDTNGIFQTATGDSIAIYTSGMYMLTSEANSGCFARDTFIVTPSKLSMDITITDVNCYGESTGELTHGQITGGTGAFQWIKWTLGDTIVNGSVAGATYSNLVAGIYSLEVLDSRNCLLSEEFEVKQNDSLRITGNVSDFGTLKLQVTGGVPPYKYEIRKEDNTLVSYFDTAWGLAVGIYHITVTDAVHCISSDTITINSVSGILEMENANSILIYPNPIFDGKLIIEDTKSVLKVGEQIAITDLTGKIVLVSTFSSTKKELDVSSLASGVYIIQIGNVREKFTK